MRVSPSEYQLEFFSEAGFMRKIGKRCPEAFWTLNEGFEEPQDTPCVEYWFDEIPAAEPLSVSQARRKFIDFFVKRGHTEVAPRPVVARWREDLYLTIASIVAFQPHVTSGLVPPPANPLVISQPSIRLEDIDNVGLTLGRHLSVFEMAAHHAFNSQERWIYWKDETVRYAYEFFTKEMGIPKDAIVFKESWWEGGGNAGPSFEVAVGGLELATLVFMMYKVTNGSYERIPLMIVDTGYGVERLAWYSQKTPTAFHAIYGNMLEKVRDLLGTERPPLTLLRAAYKAAGRLDPGSEESLASYYSAVALSSGLSVEEVKKQLAAEARLYGVLDHTKAIAMMLGDGIVPSNAGEGYLARLVIRRALRLLRLLGADVRLRDIVDMQISLWGRDFPQLLETRDYILEAVEMEEERFKDVIARGRKIVERELSKSRSISIEDLVRLYDSLGVPPEIVEEVARSLGASITVPRNFYSIVASRHRGPPGIWKVEQKEERWTEGLPATEKLYYEDPYARSFEAVAVAINGNKIVLDRTLFYPTGGGQVHDQGYLIIDGEKYPVKSVEIYNGVIVHELDRAPPAKPGSRVFGEIDWERRYKIMRHHTATHIMLGALRRVLGRHVWQAGAEKTEEKGRLDVTHHKPLSPQEIEAIERAVNEIVDSRRDVRVSFMDKGEAEARYGFVLYQGGVPMARTIRVVEIDGWDVEACGGTHVRNTGEVGGIKIVNVERIQDGIVRFEYVAGTRVVDGMREAERRLAEVASLVGASRGQEVSRLRSLLASHEAMRRTVESYRKVWASSIVEELVRMSDSVKLIVKESPESEREAVQDILRYVTERDDRSLVIMILEGGLIEMAAGKSAAEAIDVGALARRMAERMGGRGGGSRSYASLRLAEKPGRGDVERIAREILGL